MKIEKMILIKYISTATLICFTTILLNQGIILFCVEFWLCFIKHVLNRLSVTLLHTHTRGGETGGVENQSKKSQNIPKEIN